MKIFEDKTAIEVADLHSYQQPFVKTTVVRYLPENKEISLSDAPAVYISHTYVDFPERIPAWVWSSFIRARDAGKLPMDEKKSWINVTPGVVIRHAITTHDYFVKKAYEVFEEEEERD